MGVPDYGRAYSIGGVSSFTAPVNGYIILDGNYGGGVGFYVLSNPDMCLTHSLSRRVSGAIFALTKGETVYINNGVFTGGNEGCWFIPAKVRT